MAIAVDGGRTWTCERDSVVTKSTNLTPPGDLPALCSTFHIRGSSRKVEIREREQRSGNWARRKGSGELEFNQEIDPAFISKSHPKQDGIEREDIKDILRPRNKRTSINIQVRRCHLPGNHFAPGKPDLALQNQQVLEKEIYQFPLHKPHVAIKEACRLEVHHFMKSRAVQPRVIESISGKSSQNSVEGNTARKPVIACCGEVGGEENDEIRECPKFKTMKPKSERQAVNIIDNAEPPEIDENQGLADIRGRVERWDLNIESLADSEENSTLKVWYSEIGVGRKLEEVEEVGRPQPSFGDLVIALRTSRMITKVREFGST
ncbi:hypothetical protein ARMGADRAFT_1065725, partial [Armillaria gallica]